MAFVVHASRRTISRQITSLPQALAGLLSGSHAREQARKHVYVTSHRFGFGPPIVARGAVLKAGLRWLYEPRATNLSGRLVRWQSRYGAAPSTVNIVSHSLSPFLCKASQIQRRIDPEVAICALDATPESNR
jgi:hypothetical protein